MTAAERKRKQRAKAQANMTEKEKRNNKEKENKRQSQLRKCQIAKMSKENVHIFMQKKQFIDDLLVKITFLKLHMPFYET